MICVTGKIGSGKSTVSKIISEMTGYEIIDVDKIGHEVLEMKDVKTEVLKAFGKKILSGGNVDRKKLAKVAFSNGSELEKLESILHPIMRALVVERVRDGNAVIDCALLKRMKLLGICDVVITVISNFENSRNRKQNLTDEEFEKIWGFQEDVDMIGIVLENDSSLEDLRRKVRDVLEMIS